MAVHHMLLQTSPTKTSCDLYACAAVFLGYFLLNFGYFEFFGWELPGASSSAL